MTTAIIDYGSGNLRSAEKSFQRAAREVGGGEIVVTADPEVVRRADPRLDRRGGRAYRAERPHPQNPAYGLERPVTCA